MAQLNYSENHKTKTEADAAATKYETSWPPQGYGTRTYVYHLTVPDQTGNEWVMSASRFDSCD
jgi:hypothetical protein